MRREDPHHFLFYCPDLDPVSGHVRLDGDEHQHLSRVLRMRPGEGAYVTDGRGRIVHCEVETVGKQTTDLVVRKQIEGPALQPVTLALACLKKDAFELAVRQCTELGCARFIPFACAKSHLRAYSPNYLDRLRRVALGAMKQSFRATLPVIEPAIGVDGLVDRIADYDTAITGDADAAPWKVQQSGGSTLIIVGPEAGFSSEEREQLQAVGCTFVSVSSNRLRSETAAVALSALILAPHRRGHA